MLRNRYLSVYTLSFAAGIAAGFCVYAAGGAVSFILLGCLCVSTVVLAVLFRKKREVLLYVLIVGIGLLCGGLRFALASFGGERYAAFVGREDTAVGTVVESASSAESTERLLRVERSRIALPKGTLLVFYAETELPVRVGDRVTVTLTGIRKPGVLHRAEGASLAADGQILSVHSGDGVQDRFLAAVRAACERLYAPYGEAGTAQALLLRERSMLEAEEISAYRNAGLAHLLAVSGLHLTILLGVFRRFVRHLRLPRWLSALVTLAALLAFCGITAYSPSVVRAAVMAGVLTAGDYLVHRTDRLSILFAALLAFLLANPYALRSAGLQLSFLACLGLLLLRTQTSRLRHRIRKGHYWGSKRLRYRLYASLTASLLNAGSIVLFTFPTTVFSFGTVAYLSPLANLLVLPLFSLLLVLLLLSVAAYAILPPLAPLLAFLPGQALRLLRGALVFLDTHGIGSADAEIRWMVLPAFLAVCAVLSALIARKRAFRLYACFFAAFALTLAIGLLAS